VGIWSVVFKKTPTYGHNDNSPLHCVHWTELNLYCAWRLNSHSVCISLCSVQFGCLSRYIFQFNLLNIHCSIPCTLRLGGADMRFWLEFWFILKDVWVIQLYWFSFLYSWCLFFFVILRRIVQVQTGICHAAVTQLLCLQWKCIWKKKKSS